LRNSTSFRYGWGEFEVETFLICEANVKPMTYNSILDAPILPCLRLVVAARYRLGADLRP
jgi:hypothetical protein